MTATPNTIRQIPLRNLAKRRGVVPFERGPRPRDHIYASELGKCARAVWFDWHYPEVRDNAFSETRGALGHAIEEVMARQLSPLVVAREVSFYDEKHHLSGRSDFVVRMKHHSPMLPLEVKSTYAYDRFRNEPLPGHVLQLRYYLSQIPEAPFGVLVYYCLSNWGGHAGEWTALAVPPDTKAVVHEAARLWDAVHQDLPPPCERAQEKDGCFDCSISAERRLEAQMENLL